MSLPNPCLACSIGRHEDHEPGEPKPGLIGGEYCDCNGECVDNHDRAARLLWDIFAGPALPESDQT